MPECEERLDGRERRAVAGVFQRAVGERTELAARHQPFEQIDRFSGLRGAVL